MRHPDWEKRLSQAMRKHALAPFEYGVCDCFTICADAVEAVTGEHPFPDVPGAYSSAEGAAKLMLKRGFKDVRDVWASLFDAVHPAMAQRGDICIFDLGDGVIIGAPVLTNGALVKMEGQKGPLFLPAIRADCTFRVGR